MSTPEPRPSSLMKRDIAVRIVESAKTTIAYNINIMDERGVIVASSNPERVGSFHEIAASLLAGTDDTLETYEVGELMGTRQGINTAIKYKHQKIGVLGITGAPDAVRPFVSLLKLAVEAMIEHEIQQRAYLLRASQQSLLEAGFLYGSMTDDEMKKWAMELKFDRTCTRIPLWVHTPLALSTGKKAQCLEKLTCAAHASSQDILTQWKDNGFVIFKAIPDHKDIYTQYRTLIQEYLASFLACLAEQCIPAQVFAGSFVHQMGRYHQAYLRATWVFEHCPDADEPIAYFYDHLDQWAQSYLPHEELADVFRFFARWCDERMQDMLVKTEHALVKSTYNFERASQKLFVHKNTLFQWTNNIRKHFAIDPVQNQEDRAFLHYLCHALRLQKPNP